MIQIKSLFVSVWLNGNIISKSQHLNKIYNVDKFSGLPQSYPHQRRRPEQKWTAESQFKFRSWSPSLEWPTRRLASVDKLIKFKGFKNFVRLTQPFGLIDGTNIVTLRRVLSLSLSLLLSMGRAWNIDTIANWSGFLSDRERVAVAELLSYQSGHGPWPRVRWLNIAIKFLLDEPIRFFIFKENYIDITLTLTLIQGKNFVNLYGITVFLSHACFSRPTVMRRRTRCELTIH